MRDESGGDGCGLLIVRLCDDHWGSVGARRVKPQVGYDS